LKSVEASLLKAAVRVLGIAESAPSNARMTILGGVIMRADLIIDGMEWTTATIGGMDSTDAVLNLVHKIGREDLGCIMLHGSVIALYNMIDLQQLNNDTGLPIISVTKEAQGDIRQHLMRAFPDEWQSRWDIACKNGPMQPIMLQTGNEVFVQFFGAELGGVKTLLERLTRFGGLPEPIRVSRLFARTLARTGKDD
jgi:endonuclease V-like protein UPF0215 family